MVGVEAGRLEGIRPERHAARFQGGRLGKMLQGTKTWLLANDDGPQIQLTRTP